MSDLLYILLIIYFFLFLHEISHLIIYIFFKLPINRFYIFPFNFYNNNENIKFKIKVVDLCLGLVVPKLPKLNDNNYNDIKKIISYSLISAPIMHILAILTAVFIQFNYKSIYILYIIGINIFMLLTTIQKNKNVYGDIIAFYYMKKSPLIANKILKGFVIGNTDTDNENIEYLNKKLDNY